MKDDWDREVVQDLIVMPNSADTTLYIDAASYLSRQNRFSAVVALHEFDVLTAAFIREHLNIAGAELSQVRFFRDKLAMRLESHKAGIRVPSFTSLANYQDVKEFTDKIPSPWMLKPRANAGGIGIKKIKSSDELWAMIGELENRPLFHERPSYYLLERYIQGDVYHVDSLLHRGKVVFSSASRYSRPPFNIYEKGGIFSSCIIKHNSKEEKQLFKLNREVVAVLGLKNGPAHTEFIRSAEDGHFYFLEMAARVGGANIAETCEAAYGINLWAEWANIETESQSHPYKLETKFKDYAGVVISLARQEWPDTSSFNDKEMIQAINKRFHVGLILRSEKQERVAALIKDYEKRIEEEFATSAPPIERPEEL